MLMLMMMMMTMIINIFNSCRTLPPSLQLPTIDRNHIGAGFFCTLFDITIPTPRGRKTKAQLEANKITVGFEPSLLIVFNGVVRHSDCVSASGVGLFATRL